MFNSHFYNIFALIVMISGAQTSWAVEFKELSTDLEVTFAPIKTTVKGKTVETENKIKLIGRNQGIRHKKVTVFNINVYEARLFFDISKNKITDAAELISSNALAVKLNPLRSFSGDKLKEAMLVSYEKNSIKPDSKAQIKFLDLVSRNKVIKNEPVYLVGQSFEDSDELHLMMKGMDRKIKGPKGFVKEVFSVWLGIPVDKDLEKLKEILISEIGKSE